MQPISLLVTYTMRPGAAQTFVSAVQKEGILEKIHREDGCLRYEYALSLQQEDTLFLLEKWESLEKQKIHVTQPHMARLTQIKEQYALDTAVVYFQSM